MFHALPCASYVLRPALRPTMRFVPCVRINIALYLLRRVHAPRLPCATSCTVPHFSVTTLVYPAVWQFQALRPVLFAVTASNIIGRKSLRQ